MSKLHPFFAVFFLFGGLLIALGFYILVGLAHMEAGMSAGPVPGGPSITPLVVSFEAFFVCGVVASFLPHAIVRRILAVVAHVALIFAGCYLCHVGLPVVNIITGFILATAVIYAYSWSAMIFRYDRVA